MRILRGSTYANVTSTAALVIALGIGGAQAATMITGSNIKDGTVTSADVKNGSLTGTDIGDGKLGLADLAPSARSQAYRAQSDGVPINAGYSSAVEVTLQVPAGSYVVYGQVNPVGHLSCNIQSGGSIVADDVEADYGVTNIMYGLSSSTTARTLSMFCTNTTAPGGSPTYVSAPEIIAIRLAGITG